MNYNELFDLIYSTRLPESLKEAVIDRLPLEMISEDFSELEPATEAYLEFLDTLVFSTASEALIEDIIDETLENVDEDVINEVSDAWVKRKIQAGLNNGLKQREKAYKESSSNVIGLSSLDKASKAEDRLNRAKDYAKALNKSSNSNTSTPSKSGAMDKLKSAVGKVKNWFDSGNTTTYDDVRHAIGRTAAENEKKGKPNFSNPTVISAGTGNIQNGVSSNNTSSATPNSSSASSNNQVSSTPNGKRKRSEKSENAIQQIRLERRKLKAQKRAEREAEAEEKRQRHERNEQVKAAIKQRRAGNSTPSGSDDSDNLKNFKDAVQKIRLGRHKLKAQKRLEKENNNNKKPAETSNNVEAANTQELIKNPSQEKTNSGENEIKKSEVTNTEASAETPKTTAIRSGRGTGRGRGRGNGKNNKNNKITAEETSVTNTGKGRGNSGKNNKNNETSQPSVNAGGEEKNTDNKQNEGSVENPKKAVQKEYNDKGERIVSYKGPEGQHSSDIQRMIANLQSRRDDLAKRPDAISKSQVKELDDKIAKLQSGLHESCMVDLISLLGNTNISESSFVEIMELFVPNKKNATKVKERHDNEFKEAANTLNAETNDNNINPETVERVNTASAKKEKFDEMFQKRFGDS